MFTKNIMTKSKQMTEALQAENLNVVDAMTIIMATVESLSRINKDEKAMDDEIQAGILFAKKLGGNPEVEFSRKHCIRRPPRRIDDNPYTQAELSIFQFIRENSRRCWICKLFNLEIIASSVFNRLNLWQLFCNHH